MEPVAFKPEMDKPAKILLGASAFLPWFLLAFGMLSGNYILTGLSLLLAAMTITFIVWPLLHAIYVVYDDHVLINYFRPVEIKSELIEGISAIGGSHKYALSGFGYYCTNFKDRVLIKARKGKKLKDCVISPPNPDAFVKLVKKNLSINKRMTKEDKPEEKPKKEAEPKKEETQPKEPESENIRPISVSMLK